MGPLPPDCKEIQSHDDQRPTTSNIVVLGESLLKDDMILTEQSQVEEPRVEGLLGTKNGVD